MSIFILFFSVVTLVLAVFVIRYVAKQWIRIAKEGVSDKDRKSSVRAFIMVSVAFIAFFSYFHLSMGYFPEEDVVIGEAREYLEQTYGHPASKWQVAVKGKMKKPAYDPPKKYYRLIYSYKDIEGRLLVECTDYEQKQKLTITEDSEPIDNEGQ